MPAGDLLSRIIADPNVCFGKPCIRGTRIWVSLILDNLAEGVSEEALIASFPNLQLQDIRAAIAYGAAVTRDCMSWTSSLRLREI